MPLELLEDAFHMLRQLPASAWVAYFTGAVPFLMAVLFSGLEAAATGYTPGRALGESLLCAGLFVWMQVWKARFAALMRAQLSATEVVPWTGAAVARGIALQCSLQPVKLFAIPLAALVLLPFAWTVAFFRNVTSLALDPGLNARQSIGASARFATSSQRSTWVILGILSALALAIFIDIMLVLAVLPTRGTVFNFMFLATGAALTWLVLDPLLQAVSARLCFQAQSSHSGADLLAALRRLAPVMGVLALLTTCARAEERPRLAPDRLEQSIDRVLEQRSYAWQHKSQSSNPLLATRKWLNERFGEFARWVRRMFKQQPDHSPEPTRAPPRTPLRWTIYLLLTAIAAGLVKFLTRGRPLPAAMVPHLPVDLSGERIAASDLPEDRWIAMAHECLDRGEYRLALRALYLANLAHLGERQLLTILKSKTNRDYERELRRRSRSPDVLAPFHRNLVSFECAWYGDHPVAESDVQAFEHNFMTIRTNREA